MADMFPGSALLGDSVASLFNPKQTMQMQDYQQLMQENQQLKSDRVSSGAQDQGVQSISNNSEQAARNAPTRSKPTATTDPMEVESAWMARLAKFAGIAGSTGVKLGGL